MYNCFNEIIIKNTNTYLPHYFTVYKFRVLNLCKAMKHYLLFKCAKQID